METICNKSVSKGLHLGTHHAPFVEIVSCILGLLALMAYVNKFPLTMLDLGNCTYILQFNE